MFKDFRSWFFIKQNLHNKIRKIYFYEREIWWCSLGLNIGYEQDGKNRDFERPVLIVRVFNAEVLWAVPLTSRDKKGEYYYRCFFKNRIHTIILTQLRLISSRRLLRKIGVLSEDQFNEVVRSIKSLLIEV